MGNGIRIQVERRREGVVLRVHGELDVLTSPDLVRAAAAELGAGARRMVVDLAHVRFVGSSGICAIFACARAAAAAGAELAVARASAFCSGVLRQVGLDRCISILERAGATTEWFAAPEGCEGFAT